MKIQGWKLAMGALALSMLAAGCQQGGGGAAAGGGAGAGGSAMTGQKLRIGVSIPAADHGWTAGVNWWAEQAKGLYPEVEWTITSSKTPEDQINAIETMLTKGLDGIVVLATESAPLTPMAEKIKEQGVFLVNVDRGFTKPVADIFLEGDNVAFGRKSAEFMASKLAGKGDIVILEGISSTVNTDRVNAFRETMKAFPGIRILDSQSGEWNREKALNVTQGLLQKHQKIDAIWASDDDMALGAEQALKDANRTGIWMLGGAGMKDIVKRVKDGDPLFPANITYPPSMIAMGMHLCVSTLRDGKKDDKMKFVPRHILIDVELITPENADRFYFPDSKY